MKYIIVSKKNSNLCISLNRPETGNCYHFDMCKEISEAFKKADQNYEKILLTGNGNNFCTGADLRWMKASASLSLEENIKDMSVIKEMYRSILECPIPIITKVQGKIRGGGMGLVACSDYVISDSNADFALSEVKLGLIPGIITPFVAHRIGEITFNELASSGMVIDANEAKKMSLIHEISNRTEIPEIKATHKEMLKYFSPRDLVQDYLEASARKRQSPEFLKKIEQFFN